MIKRYQLLVLYLFAFCIFDIVDSNKYSKKSNENFEKHEYKKDKIHDKSESKHQKYDGKKKEYDPRRQENDHIYEKKSYDVIEDPNADLRKINKPFRMSKLNHLWTKAQSRLTEPKLKSIYAELKIHDKEEIALKKIKHEGNDKDGLMEAELGRKLLTLMNNYGLTEHAAEVQDPGRKQGVEPFTEKKLNKLWIQAESSGFTAEELQILKEEFLHHQQKLDEYYAILNDVGERTKNNAVNSVDDKHERFNELSQLENNDPVVNEYLTKVNELRDKHKELREDYDRLYRMSMVGAKNQEFTEPRVQGLWKIALKANFTTEELDSIRTELIHYEKRLLKLRRLHVEAVMEDEQRKSRGIEKIPGLEMTDDLIKKQSRKVAKMHLDIESRIMERHTEL